jgi:hypothetical protein
MFRVCWRLADIGRKQEPFPFLARRPTMKKKYIVKLTSEERGELQAKVKKGKAAAYEIKHSHILLNADQDPEGTRWKDAENGTERVGKAVFGAVF